MSRGDRLARASVGITIAGGRTARDGGWVVGALETEAAIASKAHRFVAEAGSQVQCSSARPS